MDHTTHSFWKCKTKVISITHLKNHWWLFRQGLNLFQKQISRAFPQLRLIFLGLQISLKTLLFPRFNINSPYNNESTNLYYTWACTSSSQWQDQKGICVLRKLYMTLLSKVKSTNPYNIRQKTNFWLESSGFPRLSRTVNLLSGLSGPGKCQNKIIGLSKFSRTNMNPDYTFYKAALVYMHNKIGMGLQFSTGVWSISCSVNFFHHLLSQLGCLVPY